MSHPRRSFWLAGAGALTLALIMSGLVLGRVDLKGNTTTTTTLAEVTPAVDTTATFEDLNGNGIDDDCEAAGSVVADPTAAATAEAAVDANADGVISVSEAAHSGRTGGKNCNHGGYVSWVAHGSPAGTTATTTDASADKAAAKAAKEAAKAAKKAAKDAAKAERKAAHAAAKAAKKASK